MSNDTVSAALEDSKTAEVSSEKVKAIENLVTRQIELEDLVDRLENQLKIAKSDLQEVQDKLLPETMLDMNCSRFDTASGLVVKVEPAYYASIKKEDQKEVYDWIISQGNEGIIESNVLLPFGKGEHLAAADAAQRIHRDMGLAAEVKESIHWATLRAFARELIEEGQDVHPKLNVHQVNRAKIKRR